MLKVLAIVTFFASLLLAQEQEEEKVTYSTEETREGISTDLKYNRYWLGLYGKEDQIRITKDKDDYIKGEFLDYNNINVSKKPTIRPLSQIDTISIHPGFPYTVTLPAKAEITFVKAYPKTLDVDYDLNLIDIYPKKGFIKSTIKIKYLFDGRPKIMDITASKYSQENEANTNEFKDKHRSISTVIQYKQVEKIDPQMVLKYFIQVYKRLPGNFDSVDINGFTYRFLEDPQGKLLITNKRFKVIAKY